MGTLLKNNGSGFKAPLPPMPADLLPGSAIFLCIKCLSLDWYIRGCKIIPQTLTAIKATANEITVRKTTAWKTTARKTNENNCYKDNC